MGKQENYIQYQDAKSLLEDAIINMSKYGQALELSETEIARDIKEVINDIDKALSAEFE